MIDQLTRADQALLRDLADRITTAIDTSEPTEA